MIFSSACKSFCCVCNKLSVINLFSSINLFSNNTCSVVVFLFTYLIATCVDVSNISSVNITLIFDYLNMVINCSFETSIDVKLPIISIYFLFNFSKFVLSFCVSSICVFSFINTTR